ncbi:MAG: flagellar filament capping protein FliD [Oscillospiraceae bacterium]|nr:flagellar filament capping protein FliD [Oscillospiraceae bacterium]
MSTISNSTNRVAGLMSGLDTEELVKALTTNTKNRINSQKQKLQLLQWKQESYRSIISKITSFKDKFLKIESETSIKAAAVMKKHATSVSNEKVISATASADAVAAKYLISQASSAKAATFGGKGAVTSGEVKLNFSNNNKGYQYFVDVELDGISKKIEFRGGDGADGIDTAEENFLKAVNDAFKDELGGKEFKFRRGEDGSSYLGLSGDDGIRHSICVGAQISAVGLGSTAYSNTTKSSTLGSVSFLQELKSSDGKYNININGVDFEFNDNTTIAEMISTINGSKAGAVLSFSNVSQTFTLESATSGATSKLEVYQSHGNLLNAMFGWDNSVGESSDPDASKVITAERISSETYMSFNKLSEYFKDGFDPDNEAGFDGKFKIYIDGSDEAIEFDVGAILSKKALENATKADPEKTEWTSQDIVDAFNAALDKALSAKGKEYKDADGNKIEFFKYDDSKGAGLMKLDGTYELTLESNEVLANGITNKVEVIASGVDTVSESEYLVFDVDGQQVLVKAADGEKVTINDLISSGLFEYSKGVLTPVKDKVITLVDEDAVIDEKIIDSITGELEFEEGTPQDVIDAKTAEARAAAEEKAKAAVKSGAEFIQDYFEGKEVLKGAVYGETQTTQGENSTITVSNDGGKTFTKYTSSNGSFTFDGTTINVNEMQNFEAASDDDYITVDVTKDNSAVLDVIKQFVEDYNTLLDELYEEIGTNRPKSQGSYFDPLTEEQEEEMSEKEIEKWNENAQKGLLYRDSNIQRFLSDLRGVMTTRINGFGLANLGVMVTNSWEDHGKIEIKDENALLEAIEMNGDKIADFFTGTSGFASKIEGVIDKALSTTTGKYGYLAALAGIEGTKTVDDNQIFKQISYIQDIIDRLNERYEKEQSRYWSKYTRLEKYMANAQSQMSYFTDSASSY